MSLSADGWSAEECLDFDFMIEQFDMWLEGRMEETVEKAAPKKQKSVVHEKKYKTLPEILALVMDGDAFAQDEDEEALADLVASGEIALSELSARMSSKQ